MLGSRVSRSGVRTMYETGLLGLHADALAARAMAMPEGSRIFMVAKSVTDLNESELSQRLEQVDFVMALDPASEVEDAVDAAAHRVDLPEGFLLVGVRSPCGDERRAVVAFDANDQRLIREYLHGVSSPA